MPAKTNPDLSAPHAAGHLKERDYCRASSTGSFARFFGRRNGLDLDRDASGHRRFAWLYEDMLT